MTDNISKAAILIKDPVCGMDVNPATSKHKVEHAGKSFFFCCAGCADKFKSSPDKYLNPAASRAGSSNLMMLGGPAAAPAVPHSPDSAKERAYVCPMCPEVRASKPGPCPKCGMALESEAPQSVTRTEYTCPMHPEIVRSAPGSCPICGMALEPRTVTAVEEDNPELRDMTRRFWISLGLTVPLLILAMEDMAVGSSGLHATSSTGLAPWIELLLATPVVLWGGWPFFQRGWTSIINRSTNMFTLIAMGTGVAYIFSLIATVFPGLFPLSFRDMNGTPPVYFEAAAAIVTLVLMGQVLELRARSR